MIESKKCDSEFLRSIYSRLLDVHGEVEMCDHMLRLNELILQIEKQEGLFWNMRKVNEMLDRWNKRIGITDGPTE